MYVITDEEIMKRFDEARTYANYASGCLKVKVGAVIFKEFRLVSLGANKAIPDLCKGDRGCLRIEKYGNNSRLHRGSADCRAIHSEVDAIAKASTNLIDATIYITRYPCEACARAIVAAGITTVMYGRDQEISEETKEIFDLAGVAHIHYPKYQEDDVIE